MLLLFTCTCVSVGDESDKKWLTDVDSVSEGAFYLLQLVNNFNLMFVS